MGMIVTVGSFAAFQLGGYRKGDNDFSVIWASIDGHLAPCPMGEGAAPCRRTVWSSFSGFHSLPK